MFFSKKGFSTGADPLFCAFLRNVAAAVVFWPVVALMGGSRAAMQSLRSGRGVLPRMALGAVLGPGIGMWLSLVAVANTDTGVAATLIGLEPIAIMPVVWFMTGRRPTVRAVVGAAVAFAGTALLLMRHHL
jgi:drug/metabolite transporter (DMT)-like permease